MLYKFLKLQIYFCFFVVLFTTIAFAQSKEKPNKCIMVFGAHSDDVEEIAGGTFAKYIAEGYQGIYVCVMNNLSGSQISKVPGNWDFFNEKPTLALIPSPKMYQVGALESHQQRTEEAMNAAKVFGAVPVFLNFGEPELWLGRKLIIYGTKEFLQYNPPGRKQIGLATRYSEDVNLVVDLLKKYKPEITIIHTPGGEKLDHGNSGYLMYLAFKKAMAMGVPLGKLWTPVFGWLLDNKTTRGKSDIQINVKDYLKVKYEALDKHLSQNGGEGRKLAMENKKQPEEIIEEFITVIDNTE